MSFKIVLTPEFEKELKKLLKRHVSLKHDILQLLNLLKIDPTAGKALGNDAYKIRLAITSKNKGKSGGARVVTYVKIVDEVVYLISIYDKSDTDSISDNEILSRIKLFK